MDYRCQHDRRDHQHDTDIYQIKDSVTETDFHSFLLYYLRLAHFSPPLLSLPQTVVADLLT